MAFMYHHQSKKNVQFILPPTTFKMTLLMENMSFTAQFKLFTNPLESKSLKVERNQNKTVDFNPFPAGEIIPKPLHTKLNYQEIGNTSSNIEYNSHIDTLWFTMKCIDNTFIDNHQTWTGFNSTVTKARSITNINTLPTDFSNLYQALKICQNISKAVAPSRKTIIILDLRLNAKALQLQGNNEIANNFVFRAGELHIVFQHAIDKYIENSGLDQSFTDCDIYGPVTVNQILNGRHMKRGMETYMVLYLALNKICLKDFSKTFPETLKSIESPLKSFCECLNILDTTKTYDAEIEAVITQLSEKVFSNLFGF